MVFLKVDRTITTSSGREIGLDDENVCTGVYNIEWTARCTADLMKLMDIQSSSSLPVFRQLLETFIFRKF